MSPFVMAVPIRDAFERSERIVDPHPERLCSVNSMIAVSVVEKTNGQLALGADGNRCPDTPSPRRAATSRQSRARCSWSSTSAEN
jgi:hypothetical protein